MQGDHVFGTWLIQEKEYATGGYSLYSLTSVEDSTQRASLWVVDFPASQEDLFVLCENGMSQEQAGAFFRQAADDFAESLLRSDAETACASLLTADDVSVESTEDGMLHTVYVLTQEVKPLDNGKYNRNLSVEDTVRLGSFLCDAILHIKDNNLPLRLLTIDNIFVAADGHYLLGSFGSDLDNRFQSPEEHRGETAVYNGDVCSVGIIMYTVLNDFCVPLLPRGYSDYTEDEIADAVQSRHAGVPLPPPYHSKGALTGVILKASAYKAKARYASVSELKSALDVLRYDRQAPRSVKETVAETEVSWTRNPQIKKVICSVVTVIVIVLVSSVILHFYDKSQNKPIVPNEPAATAPGVSNIYIDSFGTKPTGNDYVAVAPTQENVQTVTDVNHTDNSLEYPASFFSQIAAYHSGEYYVSGFLEQDGEVKKTDLAITNANSIYMTSDIDGAEVGFLRTGDGTVYLIHPAGKAYIELNKTVLRLLGMNTDTFDSVANIDGIVFGDVPADKIEKVTFRDQELIACTYCFDSGKSEVFYLDENGNVRFVESYNADKTLANVLSVDILTADVPAEMAAVPSDFTQYSGMSGLLQFASGLMPQNTSE
ncbi:MAG: hypothetical protein IJO14_12510 [Clostridia bacterium]|nr:hypothetical protein [Clostridia bacterium]